jgi:hypothetical protein
MEQEPVVQTNTGEVARFSDGSTVVRTRIAASPEFAQLADLIVCHASFQAIFAPGSSLSDCKQRWSSDESRAQPENEASRCWNVSREERIRVTQGSKSVRH